MTTYRAHPPSGLDPRRSPWPSQKPLQIVRLLLFDHVPVRDTGVYQPREVLPTLGMERWGFTVLNTTNQTVTLTPSGGDNASPDAQRIIAGAATITVATQLARQVVFPKDTVYGAYVGVQVSFGSAPTSGDVTVLGWAQPSH